MFEIKFVWFSLNIYQFYTNNPYLQALQQRITVLNTGTNCRQTHTSQVSGYTVRLLKVNPHISTNQNLDYSIAKRHFSKASVRRLKKCDRERHENTDCRLRPLTWYNGTTQILQVFFWPKMFKKYKHSKSHKKVQQIRLHYEHIYRLMTYL